MRYASPAEAEAFNAARLEDLTWMADTGESLSGAADRLGITADGLQTWLRRQGHAALHRRLLLRDPIVSHAADLRRQQWAS